MIIVSARTGSLTASGALWINQRVILPGRLAMIERVVSPAYWVLTKAARRLLAVIETEIGSGTSVALSYDTFRLDHRFGRQTLSPSLTLLDRLGLIDIAVGPRFVNVFSLSDRWRSVNEDEALRLTAQARELKPPRTAREPKPQRPAAAKAPKPVKVEALRKQRQEPSLPPMPWRCDSR
ncbi:hypothetical protein AB4Z40_32775 [Bosea sp. 2YAB26]|uniref:hypothetical protein n=1 Tax=Bosea sp. 2YAB26 TaxID=3237478 RepID=UPI003F91D206